MSCTPGTRDENGDGNSAVHAVSQATGKKLWSYPVPSSVHGSIAVSDGLVFVPTLRGTLFAVDAKTGKLVWRNDPEAAPEGFNQRTYGYYGVTVADGKVLFPYQTRHGEASRGLLVALDVKTGQRIWASPMSRRDDERRHSGRLRRSRVRRQRDGRPVIVLQPPDRRSSEWTGAAPSAAGRTASRRLPTAGSSSARATASSRATAATGATLWSYRSSSPSLVNGNATPAAAAIKGNVVYMGFPSGEVAALNADHRCGYLEAVAAGFAVPGWVVHLAGAERQHAVRGRQQRQLLRARRTAPGQPLWQHNLGTWVSAGPAVSGNTVVVGALDGNLYAFTPGGTSAKPWPVGVRQGDQEGHRRSRSPTAVTVVQNGTAIGSTSTDAAGNYRLGLEKGAGHVHRPVGAARLRDRRQGDHGRGTAE